MPGFRKITDAYSVAPQIGEDDLDAARAAGFTLVVSNRADGEAPGQPTAADIEKAAAERGLRFAHAPVSGPLSVDLIDDFVKLLDDAEGPVLGFCGSGMRSSFLWGLAQARKGALSVDDIVAAIEGAGYEIGPRREILESLAGSS